MSTIDTYKLIDTKVCNEAKVSALAKVIGYNEFGEPIEIVFDLAANEYAFHVGGCRTGDATDETVEQCFQQRLL